MMRFVKCTWVALLTVSVCMCALLAVMPALAPIALGAHYVAQGYDLTSTPTPGPSPTPTPTATPRPLILTPRPTSTGLPTPAPTPTPYYVGATPGPCTIALLSSATCKTAWRNQVVTWTLPLGVFTRTANIFDGTTRITTLLTPMRPITLTPRWQAARALTPITLTASGLTSTLWGQTLAGIVVTATRYMWNQSRGWYTITNYVRTADSLGRFTVTVTGALINSRRDYWTISAHVTQTLHIGAVYTRRLFLPIARRGG